jgi:hypothetical protein
MKQCRQESELKILIKNREVVNIKNTSFLGVINDSNLSWEVHIENAYNRISRNIFIINRPSKVFDMNLRRMYYGLSYPFLAYGIIVWGQSAEALTIRIFTLEKRAVRYTAGLKQRESCRDSFRHLKVLTLYSLYIQETIYEKEKGNCTVNESIAQIRVYL